MPRPFIRFVRPAHVRPVGRRHRPVGRRHSLAAAAAAAVTGSLLVLQAAPAAAAITDTPDATAMAAAIAAPGTTVTGASFVALAGAAANGVADAPLTTFPTNGGTFAIMTTGGAAVADDPNANPPPESPDSTDDTSTDLGGGNVRGDTDRDVSILKIDLAVPPTANCLTFDFQFLTEEFNDFVGGLFNDAFIAEMDNSTWTTAEAAIIAPNNFAFDALGGVVSVNAVGLGGFSRLGAGDTTYDGATPPLSAATPVTPGAHSLYLSIFDQGDGILDSAAFIDNLRVGFAADGQCVRGARVENFRLDLAPATATRDTGTRHTVTATLVDVDAGSPPVGGGTVLFRTTGANSATGSAVTGADGTAAFSYVGGNAGTDAISTCYDRNTNATCDPDEPFASARVTWTRAASPEPGADQGGGAGQGGAALPITGNAAGLLGLAGAVTIALGTALVVLAGRRQRHEPTDRA